MELQGLRLEIAVRSGSENNVADYLSRNPAAETDEEVNSEEAFENQIFLAEGTRELPERIANELLCDDVIKDAIIQLRKERRVITGGLKKVGDRLSLVNGKLLFKERLVVPKMLREEVMRSVHTQHHFGKEGTLQSLKRSFFWSGMSKDVETFCRNSLVCHRAKPTNYGKEPIGRMRGHQSIPGYAVGIVIGTLPWSEDGHRYFLQNGRFIHALYRSPTT